MIELDDEQRVVVDSAESMVVVSGPGSGKTRVLTEKARRLWEGGEHEVLCLTFTRSAAREMRERVPGLPACTIHSYCCGSVGWKEDWGYAGLLYRFLMRQNGKWRDSYDFILLDEAQDTNELELEVVLSLVRGGGAGHVVAVGDPFQSIYGFQGALGMAVVPILEKLAGCKRVQLRSNYRSCPDIVARLNRWFERGLVSRDTKQTGLTAVLFRRNDDLFLASNYLVGCGVPHSVRLAAQHSEKREAREYDVGGEGNAEPKARLMTVHVSKGMEFDRVVLFDWFPDGGGDDWRSQEERRIYYVALARASKEFVEVGNLEELRSVLQGAGCLG